MQSELVQFACLLPAMAIRFDQPTSGLVTVSDASEEGAGVCAATQLSEIGHRWLGQRLAAPAALLEGAVVLLESFGGICSTRQALSLLGVKPVLHLCAETNEAAMKVGSHQWPDVVQLGDVRSITRDVLVRELSSAPRLRLLLHTAGSPCQGFCAWNTARHKAAGESQHDKSMSLFHEVGRVNDLLEDLVPKGCFHFVEENVCSMQLEQRDYISRHLAVLPTKIRLRDLAPQNRDRYFWASWPLIPRAQVQVEHRKDEGYVRATLCPSRRLPTSHWAEKSWEPADPIRIEERGFPTLTRPCAVKTPRPGTPGVDRASAYALERWQADRHRRPPLHYERAVEMVQPRTGARRRKSIEEDERLHFFPADYTYQCMGGKDRKADPAKWQEDT